MTIQRADWALLAIASADGRPVTPVQLQKTLFLLSKAHDSLAGGPYYSFEPYHYGAFDADVYHDAESLARQGLVEIEPAPWHPYRTYKISEAGAEAASELEVDSAVRAHLENLMRWARSQTFAQLVSAVYEMYPETKQNSIFQDAS